MTAPTILGHDEHGRPLVVCGGCNGHGKVNLPHSFYSAKGRRRPRVCDQCGGDGRRPLKPLPERMMRRYSVLEGGGS